MQPSSLSANGKEPSLNHYEQRCDGVGSTEKTYSLSDVAMHNDPGHGGVWITMEGKVYDVTEWINEVREL